MSALGIESGAGVGSGVGPGVGSGVGSGVGVGANQASPLNFQVNQSSTSIPLASASDSSFAYWYTKKASELSPSGVGSIARKRSSPTVKTQIF